MRECDPEMEHQPWEIQVRSGLPQEGVGRKDWPPAEERAHPHHPSLTLTAPPPPTCEGETHGDPGTFSAQQNEMLGHIAKGPLKYYSLTCLKQKQKICMVVTNSTKPNSSFATNPSTPSVTFQRQLLSTMWAQVFPECV